MKREFFGEAGRFLSVGVANTLIALLIIYAAKWFLHMGDVTANLCGYSVGLMVSFSLNSRWTFSYSGPQLHALTKFLLVALVAYAINLLTVMVAIRFFELNSYVAQVIGMPAYTLTSFFLNRHLVFRNKT
jgi:putative flippase GtrA